MHHRMCMDEWIYAHSCSTIQYYINVYVQDGCGWMGGWVHDGCGWMGSQVDSSPAYLPYEVANFFGMAGTFNEGISRLGLASNTPCIHSSLAAFFMLQVCMHACMYVC